MSVAIVVLETLAIPYIYQGPINQEGYGGEWGSPQVTVHLEVPEGLDPTVVMAVRADDGTISLVEDPAKVAQKTADQWTSVRAQQRQKLYESDWTCSVIDPPPEILAQRDQWLQYRADLRAVTTQSDPFAIVWPVEPGQEVTEAEPVQEVTEAEPVQEVTEAEPVVETPVVESVVETPVAEPVVEVAEPVAEVPEAEPVVETPVVQEAEPVVETPVAEPVVETPVVQEAEPVVETPVAEVADP